MDIKGKRTSKGEYVKFIFDNMEDCESWISFLRHSFERTDDKEDKYRKAIEEFAALVEEIVNPCDSYEEGRPSITLWPDKMFYMAVAFHAVAVLSVKNHDKETADVNCQTGERDSDPETTGDFHSTVIPEEKMKRYLQWCKGRKYKVTCDCGNVVEVEPTPYFYNEGENNIYFASVCPECGGLIITKE